MTLPREKLLFLGGGRITSAIIEGLQRAGFNGAIAVYDRHPNKLKKLASQFGVRVAHDLSKALEDASILIIAVRPKSVGALLESIAPHARSLLRGATRQPIAVSLAAGIPFAQLRRPLGRRIRWARAMPSPASSTGRGLTALVFDRGFSRDARTRVRALFAPVGAVVEIPESKFDAFTATYSVSHGYHALFVLSAAAMKLSLDRRTAEIAAAHALADGILSWREKGWKLSELLHEAATPGGIAAAVMESEESAGYSKIVERALRAGVARARWQRKR
jgi:pyrroline-5-carboxylate reductase